MNGEDKFDGRRYAERLRERIRQDVDDAMMGKRGRRERRLQRNARPGILPGLILVCVGTVILLDHMGYISAAQIWRLWPVVLIVAGCVQFFHVYNRPVGAVMIVLGALFLSSNYGFLRLNWNDMWPLILIAAGVALIWSRIEMPRMAASQNNQNGDPSMVTAYAIFGGVERRINANNLRGGEISAMFGGVELDFRAAEIEGEQAILYVEAIFGGIDIVVPERWSVIYEGQSIFGGYSDETRPPLPEVPGAAPKKRLILRGRAIFGGITVKN
ncbi:MAG TPA: DUF5668 domain-containing protein [Candidatus Saccharimonadales bacterium]|nr:DUF5668 domain-containing protein [Candidatus Saccharimonadales bacterium]